MVCAVFFRRFRCTKQEAASGQQTRDRLPLNSRNGGPIGTRTRVNAGRLAANHNQIVS